MIIFVSPLTSSHVSNIFWGMAWSLTEIGMSQKPTHNGQVLLVQISDKHGSPGVDPPKLFSSLTKSISVFR